MSRGHHDPWCGERTVRDAIIGELKALKVETKTPWHAIDTLYQNIFYDRPNPSLATIVEAAALMGVQLATREGWLAFTERVANRLPPQETRA